MSQATPRPWRQRLALLATTLLLAGLAGCAAQQAYRQGTELLREGRTQEGLAQIEEAVRLEPQSPEYRNALSRERERAAMAWVERAEQHAARAELDAARGAFGEALALRPQHPRAVAGLRNLDDSTRWQRWLDEAEGRVARKDWDGARAKLREVLAENPRQPQARRLMQRIDAETTRPEPEQALAAAYRKPLSIEFKDTPLRTVFEVIARTAGLNFVFDKDVKTDQRTSVFLRNSSVDAVVRLVLMTNQLESRVVDANTVLVYPATAAKLRDYQALTVRSFYLVNAEAKGVANSVKTLLKLRDVVVDDKLNLLIVRDTPEAVKLVEKLVAVHDVPDPEVMLEVEILEVKRTRLTELGVRWPEQLSLSPIASNTTTGLTVADLRNLRSGTLGATINAGAINARKVDGDTNILANPRIRVRNRDKARIQIGERVPNITTTVTSSGFVSESITYVDVGLKLEVEPTIYLDDEVTIKVALEVSSILEKLPATKSGTVAYNIGQRTAATVLRLRDGENQVLAGLINNEDRRAGNKVPGLGELPIAGRLFGSQLDDDSRTEIVLSITPRIVRNIERPSAAMMEFDSGTETSLGGRNAAPANAGGGLGFGLPGTPPRPTLLPPSSPASAPAAIGASGGGGSATNSAGTSSTGGVATSTSAATGISQLRWQGPTQAKPGETITVLLIAQSDRTVLSAPLVIGFDPAALQVVSVTEGDYLRRGASQSSFNSRIDPTGKVFIEAARTDGPALSAPGMLLAVNLRVAANAAPASSTSLSVNSVSATTSNGAALDMALPAPQVISIGAAAP